jgi:hypothetical protein
MKTHWHFRFRASAGSIALLSLFLSLFLGQASYGRTAKVRSKANQGAWVDPQLHSGKAVLDGVTVLTGYDLAPMQTQFLVPELADPYMSVQRDGVVVSGTAQYMLKFKTIDAVGKGGPYQIVWNDFYYSDLTPMEGGRFLAHSWDMKPVAWHVGRKGEQPRLWDAKRDRKAPLVVWYGGHMRPAHGETTSRWPEDNYSRDVFAFTERTPGKWVSKKDSIFVRRSDWPRASGNYLGHRYGHQIISTPKMSGGTKTTVPSVFYEEVTRVQENGSPAVTEIFMDEMASPFTARGNPVPLISPINPKTGKPYPSAVREDGSALVEGPLYFRFRFQHQEWEAIGFSAGSFYGNYPALFASRKVAEGLRGKPYLIDLNDEGSDLHDAGAQLRTALNLAGGPGRPAVLVQPNGMAVGGEKGRLQVLVHGYRKDILPDHDFKSFPTKYRLDQMFRIAVHAHLSVSKGPHGALRFNIHAPEDEMPNWNGRGPLRLVTPKQVANK